MSRLGLSVILLFSVCSPNRAQSLVQQFENTKVFWQQMEVAKLIVAAHDLTVLPKLEPLLKAEDRHLRGNAAFIFASLGDPRGFDTIVAILNDRSPRPFAQGANYKPKNFDDAPPPEVQIGGDRYYAAHLLGDLKDPRGVPILVSLLNDAPVNSVVPWSLAQIGDASAIQPLIATLSSPSPDMRIFAIDALVDLKASGALPRLREMLDDTGRNGLGQPTSVAEVARAAIARLELLRPVPSQQ